MVLSHEKIFGKSKGEGPAKNDGPLSNKFRRPVSDEGPERIAGGVKTMAKKYRTLIDKLEEKGVVHAKGKILMVEVSDERAQNLINAGYIEEVVEGICEGPAKEKEKDIEAPKNKMEEGADKKSATGKGANLLKGKKK